MAIRIYGEHWCRQKKKKGIKSMKKSRVKLSRKQNVQTFKKGAKVKIKNVPKTSRGGIML